MNALREFENQLILETLEDKQQAQIALDSAAMIAAAQYCLGFAFVGDNSDIRDCRYVAACDYLIDRGFSHLTVPCDKKGFQAFLDNA